MFCSVFRLDGLSDLKWILIFFPKPSKAWYVFPAVTGSDKMAHAGQACKSFLFSQLNSSNQTLIMISDNFLKTGLSNV